MLVAPAASEEHLLFQPPSQRQVVGVQEIIM
jgi:hypothetical protein